VGGVVVIRYGANAREVIEAVKKKIGEIQPGLPADVKIVPFYDRSILIDHAVGTLRHALIEELILSRWRTCCFCGTFAAYWWSLSRCPSRCSARSCS